MPTITLPTDNGSIEEFHFEPGSVVAPYAGDFNRVVYAAAHIVPDLSNPNQIDWEATLNYRKYLWSLNLGVAEAMDTAQRGAGLDWPLAKELISRSLEASKQEGGGRVVCGCTTDQLAPKETHSFENIIDAYLEQIRFVEEKSGKAVMMASRALAMTASSSDDYVKVYDRVLSAVQGSVMIHWLGDMFDPALKGYWGSTDFIVAMDTLISIIKRNPGKVDGVKISLLDKEKEIKMRRLLPDGVRMYTGDDFNYPELIRGDRLGYSDALLGIFDGIAPIASAALGRLGEGDLAGFNELLEPTVALSRHIFSAPTQHYKTGLVFLAYLNGHQEDFRMLGGQESNRSIEHLAELFRLAAACGLLVNSDRAIERMKAICDLHSKSNI